MFNGVEVAPLTCNEALTCGNICLRLSREAREGNLPEPEACALCEPICPSNLGTTIVDTVSAFGKDVETAMRLIGTCFGPNLLQGCLCNLMMVRKPLQTRRAALTPPRLRADDEACLDRQLAGPGEEVHRRRRVQPPDLQDHR